MFDIGWTELLIIGALALIVVGPKDLPGLMKSVGEWAAKARSMAQQFQSAMHDAAREAEIKELDQVQQLAKQVRSPTDFNAASDTEPDSPPKLKKKTAASKSKTARKDKATTSPSASNMSTKPVKAKKAGAARKTSATKKAATNRKSAPIKKSDNSKK